MAIPLTTPISRQATQYELVAVSVNFQSATVEFRIVLLDADGRIVDHISMARGLTELGFSAIELDALEQKVVNFLKSRGALN